MKLGKSPEKCWSWVAHIDSDGRAVKQFNGKSIPAQRWMWMQLFGPIKPGFVVYSTCGDRTCCNPHHLRCGFMADANRAGNGTVLLAEDVAQLRKDYDNGLDADRIAAKFGITAGYVKQIAKGRSWGHKKLHKVKAVAA
ncbi:HNH endonuclease [Xanthomonas sp. NCPPB 1325]|uniref:HNH endonuclease n=1 Tax=Xanthomonas sp. NCPPB 1325 TaxID=487529 RepID=UPI003556F3CB